MERCIREVMAIVTVLALSRGDAIAQEIYGVFDGRIADGVNRAEPMGDLDGDGVEDFVVCFSVAGLTTQFRSAVTAVSGSTLELLLPLIPGPVGGGITDWANAAGDFNGDGIPDLMRGVSNRYVSGDYQTVFIYSGVDGSVITEIPDPGAMDWGTMLSPLGDLNQDGFDDVALGEEFGSHVFIFGGPDGHLMRSYLNVGAFADVRTVGNIDGDGVPDYAVGSAGANRVWIYSGATGALIHEVVGQGLFGVGISVTGVGDITGDGVDDFAAGAARGPTSTPAPGEVFVYDGATAEILWHFKGEGDTPDDFANFGADLDGGEDVNGDGVGDLIVTAPYPANGIGDPGYINVYSLRTGSMLYSIRRRDDDRQFLQYPRLYGDLDGDGLAEFGFGNLASSDSSFAAGRITFFKGAPGDAEQICVGLPNSTGQAARLLWSGPTRAGDERLEVRIEDGPPGELALLFYGAQQAPEPVFDGSLCVGRPAYRLTAPVALDASGGARISIDSSAGPTAIGAASAWTPGSTWVVQALYTDAAGPAGINATSAWKVVLLP